MTDAPGRIWAWGQPHLTRWSTYGGGKDTVEYVRADLTRTMTVADAAKRLIDEITRPATHEDKPDWRYLSRLDMTSLRALSEG